MIGWGYWTLTVTVIIAEVTAVAIYMGIWFPDVPQWVWAMTSIALMTSINIIAVKLFGEIEFWFSLIKVVAIIAMILVGGSVVLLGFTNNWEPVGFSNLWNHGGFFANGLSGFITSFQMILFSYIGIELIGMSAAEAENPKKTIPHAINSLMWRIAVFYVGAIAVILAIFPWQEIGNHGSPFVTMFERIGLKDAAGLINFVVITAALSSCNANIFAGSRLLFGMSNSQMAPKYFGKLSRKSIPLRALFTSVAVSVCIVTLNYFLPNKAFEYIMAGCTFIGLMVWVTILVSQMNFRKSLNVKQRKELEFKTPFAPYSSWFSLGFISLVIYGMATYENSRISLIFGVLLSAFYVATYYISGYSKKQC
jgi:AAT family amino acid transporter